MKDFSPYRKTPGLLLSACRDVPIRRVAYAIPYRNGEVACTGRVLDSSEDLYLAGGEINSGETVEDGLDRECGEELGFKVEIERKICSVDYAWEGSRGIIKRNSGDVYAVKVLREFAPLDPTHHLIWLKLSDAMRNLRFDAHGEALWRFLRDDRRPQDHYARKPVTTLLNRQIRRLSVINGGRA